MNRTTDTAPVQKCISPRHYDKVLGKYLHRKTESGLNPRYGTNSRRSSTSVSGLLNSLEFKSELVCFRGNARKLKWFLTRLHLNSTLTKTEEREFLTSYNREYSSSPDYMAMSFMARMEEDIQNRREKEENIKSAEKRYRRNKYGSLSKERVSA